MMAALRRSLKSTRHSAKRSARKTRKGRKGTKKPALPKSRSKRSSRSRSKKLNPYMKKFQRARNSGASSFTHDGKTYKKITMKTGMVAYKRA